MSKDYRYVKMITSVRWTKLRKRKINSNPICEICNDNGIITPAEEVHHISPVEDAVSTDEMERLMFDYNNLQSLCHDCHANEHARRRSHSREEVKNRTSKRTERFIKKFL